MFEVKNSLDGLYNWLQMEEIRVHELNIIQSEEQIEKGLKQNKQNFSNLWENIKLSNIYVIRISEGKKGEN